jgi:hypothetical protein
MPAIVHQVEQGPLSGSPCAPGWRPPHEFECLVKRGKDGKTPSATRKTYMLQLAGRAPDRRAPGGFFSLYTDRGKRLEREARDLYAMLSDTEPQHGRLHHQPRCRLLP